MYFTDTIFRCLCAVCSYQKLAQDVKPGSQILCADGSIVLVGGGKHVQSLGMKSTQRGNCSLGLGSGLGTKANSGLVHRTGCSEK